MMNWNASFWKVMVLILAAVLIFTCTGLTASDKVSMIPNTGDTSNIGMWTTIMVVSFIALVVIAVVLYIMKRRKK